MELRKNIRDYIKINPIDLQSNVAIGVSLPFNGEGVFNLTYTTKEQIKSNLLNDRTAIDIIIHNIWFQQYEQHDKHDWHTHTESQFTNIYYVELPDGEKTELFDEVDIDIKEGDILSFPAYIFHRSKPNISNQRKTVISFNSSFESLKH